MMAPILAYWDIRGVSMLIQGLVFLKTLDRFHVSIVCEPGVRTREVFARLFRASVIRAFHYIFFCVPFFKQLAEPIRLLLNYTETGFKDERYELGEGKGGCVTPQRFKRLHILSRKDLTMFNLPEMLAGAVPKLAKTLHSHRNEVATMLQGTVYQNNGIA